MHQVKPHDQQLFNMLEYINEYVLCFIAYTLLIFNGMNRAETTQLKLGRSVIFLLIVFIYCLNMFTFLSIVFHRIKQKMRGSKCCSCKNQSEKIIEKKAEIIIEDADEISENENKEK